MTQPPRSRQDADLRLTQHQRQQHGRILIFQFVFGPVMTGLVGFMVWALANDSPSLGQTVVVGFFLALLGLLGIGVFYSGVMALIDRVWGTVQIKVAVIRDKETWVGRRGRRYYQLRIDRQAFNSPSAERATGFWAVLRRPPMVGVDLDVYRQAVPGLRHEIVQGRWGKVIYKVIPLGSAQRGGRAKNPGRRFRAR